MTARTATAAAQPRATNKIAAGAASLVADEPGW